MNKSTKTQNKRKLESGPEKCLKIQKLNEEYDDNQLLNEMEKFTANIVVNENEDSVVAVGGGGDDDDTIDDEDDLRKFKNINHKLYIHKGFKLINRPTSKYNSYNKLTTYFGFEFNASNEFLRKDGVFKLLQIDDRPDFCFWKSGLHLYVPRMEMVDNTSKYIQFLLRSSYCEEHEFECSDDSECNIKNHCVLSSSFSYFLTGNLRMRSIKTSVTLYQVELDNSHQIQMDSWNVSNTITIGNQRHNTYIIQKCKHEACGAGKKDPPFKGMSPIYSICSKIEQVKELGPEYNNKKCYLYGKNIHGKYNESSKNIFLNTYNLESIYIVNY